jgi:phage replication initiation protein
MSRVNSLVLDGGEVKLRLLAERTAHQSPIHIDWLRFTCLLRNVVPDFGPSEMSHFPRVGGCTFPDMPEKIQREIIRSTVESFEAERRDPAFLYPAQQAQELAVQICVALGREFSVSGEIKKGQDFYKYRWSIERNNTECGWVGFLASSDSPRQTSQNQTIHANLYGHACTFAESGWNDRLASIVDEHSAKITRADLALDFFEGIPGGMERLRPEYESGAFNHRGKRPSCSIAGRWFDDCERSMYIGSKSTGKQTNVYEKGDQLFGVDKGSQWVRVELRYGNKMRVLDSDILRRPADFFAGASDWHSLVLTEAGAVFVAQSAPCDKRLPVETVHAEVHRNVRWALNTARATIATAFRHLSNSQFLELCNWETSKVPGRLASFSVAELGAAFKSAMGEFSPVEGNDPAFA